LRRQFDELVKSQDLLHRSEEKFRALVETTSDFIWEVDCAGMYTYVSPKAREMFGYEPEEMIGRTPFDFMAPDEAQRIGAEFARISGSRLPINALENRCIHKNGEVIILETSGVPVYAEDGSFNGYRGIDRNVTKRKKVEEALLESEARLGSILHGLPVLQFAIDRDHRVISWNKAIEEYSGIPAGDILGTDQQWRAFYQEKRPVLADLLVDGKAEEFPRWYGDKFSRSGLVEGAYEAVDFFPAMGGSGKWLHFTAAPVIDAHGTVTGAIETLEDITERRNAEAALRRNEEKYRLILENMQDAYFRTDLVGNVTMVSPSAARIYGYSSGEEMIGIPAASLYAYPEKREEMFQALRKNGTVTDFTGQARRKDGTLFWTSLNVQFTTDEEGRIQGTEAIVRDITERKMMEHSIQETNKILNLLNSITRHDVANQLSVLQGYTQIAAMKTTDPDTIRLLEQIDAAATTIALQLRFARTYQELGVKAPAWFRLDEVVAKGGSDIARLSARCRDIEIFADPMLEKVFSNLFDNAVRHGERVTKIVISCRKAAGGLVISVEDNGVGIPADEKEKIFERGYGKHTGFGLFLAREILSITGMTIEENGEPEKGARFRITVPKGGYRQARPADSG
ncbi:MAG: PAS domain S-box protein, partial [Methanoregulaceae archaeon]|nr:PAS domain S-box protein [Methanoregulaceae archaeon]